MSRLSHFVVGVGLIVVCAFFLLRWVMGESFVPWISTARQSGREQLERLVDTYSLEIERVRAAIEQTEKRTEKLEQQKQKAGSSMAKLNRELAAARNSVEEAEKQQDSLQARLAAGQPVKLQSGRMTTSDELKAMLERLSSRIELAKEKISFLTTIAERRQARFDRLLELSDASPVEIQKLKASFEMLNRKVNLYREFAVLIDEETAAETEMSGFFSKAQRTLEDAHAKVDARLTEIDVQLKRSVELELDPDPQSTDDLLGELRSVLARVE